MKHAILFVGLMGLLIMQSTAAEAVWQGNDQLIASSLLEKKSVVVNRREFATVEWFDRRNGFGVAVTDEEKKEVFIHFSMIFAKDGKARALTQGQKIRLLWVIDEDNKQNVVVIPQ